MSEYIDVKVHFRTDTVHRSVPKCKLDYTGLRIDHLTVVCSVTPPLNGSEAAGDLVLIQTSLLLLCKSSCYNVN